MAGMSSTRFDVKSETQKDISTVSIKEVLDEIWLQNVSLVRGRNGVKEFGCNFVLIQLLLCIDCYLSGFEVIMIWFVCALE